MFTRTDRGAGTEFRENDYVLMVYFWRSDLVIISLDQPHLQDKLPLNWESI